MRSQSFRDRHGRGLRGSLLPRTVPRFASRRRSFDRAVLEAYEPIYALYSAQLTNLDVAVDTVPRMRMNVDQLGSFDEVFTDGPIALGRIIPPAVDAKGYPTRARIVIFRMPIEQRARDAVERNELLTHVLTFLIASYLNIDPRDIDPNYQT